ncbi:hypothetical protein LGM57_17050 [Burkholderia cepacia]|uniref:hypothetical protein n=1 Tax=Burkholderia cepacia TaxID=292 RepID=UPI0019E4A321|nr:hypothetical protein [Burkholderia cepacia]MCA7978034.1 hypothetical protein [Burkholderia cepacia]NLA20964.1 hypothetical protein [Burkholderia cepacia]
MRIGKITEVRDGIGCFALPEKERDRSSVRGSMNHANDAVGAGGGSIIGVTIAEAWPAAGVMLVDRCPV